MPKTVGADIKSTLNPEQRGADSFRLGKGLAAPIALCSLIHLLNGPAGLPHVACRQAGKQGTKAAVAAGITRKQTSCHFLLSSLFLQQLAPRRLSSGSLDGSFHSAIVLA